MVENPGSPGDVIHGGVTKFYKEKFNIEKERKGAPSFPTGPFFLKGNLFLNGKKSLVAR